MGEGVNTIWDLYLAIAAVGSIACAIGLACDYITLRRRYPALFKRR